MDATNQQVIEARRRALMDTINTYTKWRLTQDKIYPKSKRSQK